MATKFDPARFRGFSDNDKHRTFEQWQALRRELGRSTYYSSKAEQLRQRDAQALGADFYKKDEEEAQ